MGYGYINGCGFGVGGGFTLMFLFLILIGFLVYFMIRNQNHGNQYKGTNHLSTTDALGIAKSRLAKGEITTEEYEEIKKNL